MKFSPLIIEPFLIPQPTWGGMYIAQKKGWAEKEILKNTKIGQSYELFGKSRIYPSITDTNDPSFLPLVKNTPTENNATPITDIISKDPEGFLGHDVAARFTTVPILIKFTQARGNSFQLHIPHGTTSNRWKPKAESWYYFEPGTCTFGLSSGASKQEYKSVCQTIDAYMQELSSKVISGQLALADAKRLAEEKIKILNPWQFVNTVQTHAGDLIDLSLGGIHHSWEEDPLYPQGNILYEVQEDVADEYSTLRSFDQGKFLDDGSVRTLTINDFFSYLDTNPVHNNPIHAKKNIQDGMLVKNKYYSMEIHSLLGKTSLSTQDSFVHIFVNAGSLTLTATERTLTITAGHSAIIPYSVGHYDLLAIEKHTSYIITQCPTVKGDSL